MRDHLKFDFSESKACAAALLLSAISFIGMFLFLGFCAHPSADDYSFANRIINDGFLQSIAYWYNCWCGRYTSSALMSGFVYLFDPLRVYWLIPLFLILVTCASFSFFLFCLSKGRLSARQSTGAGLVLTTLYLSGVPTTAETFFWLAGGVTYQLGNCLYLLLLGILLGVHQSLFKPDRTIFLAAVLLVLLLAGLNETMMMLQTITLAVAALLGFRKGSLRFTFALFLVSLLGAAVVIAAPGNAVRSSYFPHSGDLYYSIGQSLRHALLALMAWVKSPQVLLSTLILVPAGSAVQRFNRFGPARQPLLPAVTFTWLALFTLTFFPAFWSMGGPPPPRTLSITYLIFMLGWFTTMFLFGASLQMKRDTFSSAYFTFVALVLAASLYTTGNGVIALKDAAIAPAYSAQIHKRYERIARLRAANKLDIRVPILLDIPQTIHVDDLSLQLDDWKNINYAEYFQVRSVVPRWQTDTVAP